LFERSAANFKLFRFPPSLEWMTTKISGTNFKKKCCKFPADLEKRPQFSAQPMTAFSKRIFRWKDETVGHRIHANGTFTYMKTIKIIQMYTVSWWFQPICKI